MEPRETKAWPETYLSIVGLNNVDFSNEIGALSLECRQREESGYIISARAFVTRPGDAYRVSMVAILGSSSLILLEEPWSPSALQASSFEFFFTPELLEDNPAIARGTPVVFTIENMDGGSISGTIPLCRDVPLPPPIPICTERGADPWSPGTFVACCGKTEPCLGEWNGDGNWFYQCQPSCEYA